MKDFEKRLKALELQPRPAGGAASNALSQLSTPDLLALRSYVVNKGRPGYVPNEAERAALTHWEALAA